MAAYATAADLLKRYDARILGDLAADDGEQVSAGDLATDPNLAAALEDASGEIEAALLQGKRYSVDQLTALTGNSRAYLIRICCQIAVAKMWERRLYLDSDQQIAAEQAQEQARKALQRLKTGEEVFNVDVAKAAGLPSVSTPSRVQINRRNLLVDRLRGRIFPTRMLPNDPSE